MGLATGTKLGPYEIQSPLAVKVLPERLSSDPSLRQRLEREAKAASKLTHPHIYTLHDIGHQNGVDFLVMELVDGETLEHRLLKGPLPADQAIRYSAQIASALAKAHRLGITHRDPKPGNIMLTKSGAKLMDFGLAKSSERARLASVLTEMTAERAKLTSQGMLVGTFQYMAPEQLEGKEADARTDIFALGEMIYEMATGKPAFNGKSRASLIAAVLSSEPQPMAVLQPMTPSGLERVVKKCLAKDPEERWQSASDLASELSWTAEIVSQVGASRQAAIRPNTWQAAGWLVAVMFFLVMIVAAVALWKASNRHPSAMYFHIAVPFAANELAMSPDGRTLAIVAYSAQANNASPEKTRIVSASANAVYAESGYLLYMRDNKTLVAQPFDRRRYVLSGEPRILSDQVLSFPHVYRAVFSAGADVLFTQTAKGASISQLTWFDDGRWIAYASNETGTAEMATGGKGTLLSFPRRKDNGGGLEHGRQRTGGCPDGAFSDPSSAADFRTGRFLLRYKCRRSEIFDSHKGGGTECRAIVTSPELGIRVGEIS